MLDGYFVVCLSDCIHNHGAELGVAEWTNGESNPDLLGANQMCLPLSLKAHELLACY